MRMTICTAVLIFGPVLTSQARPSPPAARHVQQVPVYCGWISVRVRPMTRPFAQGLGMVEPYGAIFNRPEPGSPAAQAGIEAGDVVTAINGTPLARARDFAGKISNRAPPSRIHLTVYRNGELMDFKVRVGYSNCKHGSGARHNSKT
jgi:serine protease Do